MSQWIEVQARYEKLADNGAPVKVTDPYLVDALSCTEAEARVVEEITPFVSGEFNVLKVSKTKISEIFWDKSGDRFYKAKLNFITIDERSGTEKRSASFIVVQASSFKEAYDNLIESMKGTLANYEVESVAETRYVDVLPVKLSK